MGLVAAHGPFERGVKRDDDIVVDRADVGEKALARARRRPAAVASLHAESRRDVIQQPILVLSGHDVHDDAVAVGGRAERELVACPPTTGCDLRFAIDS